MEKMTAIEAASKSLRAENAVRYLLRHIYSAVRNSAQAVPLRNVDMPDHTIEIMSKVNGETESELVSAIESGLEGVGHLLPEDHVTLLTNEDFQTMLRIVRHSVPGFYGKSELHQRGISRLAYVQYQER